MEELLELFRKYESARDRFDDSRRENYVSQDTLDEVRSAEDAYLDALRRIGYEAILDDYKRSLESSEIDEATINEMYQIARDAYNTYLRLDTRVIEEEQEVEVLEPVGRVIEEQNASITQMYIQREIERLAAERGRSPEDYTTGPITAGDDTERDGLGDDNPLNYMGIFEKNKKKEIVRKRVREVEKEVEEEQEVEVLEPVGRVIEEPNASITQMHIDEEIAKLAAERGKSPEDYTTGPITAGDDTERDGLGDDNPLNYIGIFEKVKKVEKVKKIVKELVEVPFEIEKPEKPTERKKDKPEPTPEPPGPEPVPPQRGGIIPPEPPGPDPVPPQRGGIIPPEPPGPDPVPPEPPVPPIQTVDDKKPVVVEKTGLQIFREQYREMPEMKRKHAIGEIPFLGLLPAGVIVGGAIAGLTFPWSLIPMAGAAVVGMGTRPLLRLISGERKIQKQIEKQLSEMSDEEFLKMASYLDEETIITLKPHHVITRALEKEARRRTNPKYLEVRKLYSEYLARAEELANKSSRTPAEDDELTKLVGEDGLIKKQEALMDGYNKLNKNIKRGAERVTATFKGNFRGLLNLFHRRNSTTKEYQPALEEYADAELKMLTARAEGDRAEEAKAMAEMPRVMEKYTIVRGIGPLTVSRGPFNSGDKGTTRRVVSDKKDNTIRNAAMLAIAASAVIIGQREMARLEEAGNKNYQEATRIEQAHNAEAQRINKDLNNLQNQVQQGQGGVVAPTAQEATKMTNAIKTLGVQADEQKISRAAQEQFGTQSYHLDHQKMDAFWNGRTYSSDLQGVSGVLRDTSGRMQSGFSELAANAARYKNDHTRQLAEYRDAEEGLKLLADLIDQIRGLPGIIGQIQIPQGMTPLTANVQQVVADWTPLIMGALPTAGVIAKDANDNSQQRKKIIEQRQGREI